MTAIVFISIALSIDALGIGATYGLRGIKISIFPNAVIFIMSAVIMGMSIGVGMTAASFLGPGTAEAAGIAILIAMGGWIIYQALFGREKDKKKEASKDHMVLDLFIRSMGISIQIIRHPELGDADGSKFIDPLEAIYVGLALSIDSMGAGVGSGAAGLGSAYVPLMAAAFQVMFLYLGGLAGKKCMSYSVIKRFGNSEKLWSVISGAMIITLGVLRLLF